MVRYDNPVVNAKTIVQKAVAQGHATGHFNAMNLVYIRAIIRAANELQTPVIIAVTEAKLDFLGGLRNFAEQVRNTLSTYTNPIAIAIHLDHAHNLDNCFKAITEGFSSVMYDGSMLPLETNIANLNKLIPYAQKHNVTIEAEIGSVGGVEDGVIGMGVNASVAEAKQMAKVKIDLLAAAVGNIHGKYLASWKGLNFPLISQLKTASQKHLVLHGASGIPDDQIKRAIKLGVSKINVSSELNWAFGNTLRKQFTNRFLAIDNWQDPRHLFAMPEEAVYKLVKRKIALFTS